MCIKSHKLLHKNKNFKKSNFRKQKKIKKDVTQTVTSFQVFTFYNRTSVYLYSFFTKSEQISIAAVPAAPMAALI